jgi:hypothetical protein
MKRTSTSRMDWACMMFGGGLPEYKEEKDNSFTIHVRYYEGLPTKDLIELREDYLSKLKEDYKPRERELNLACLNNIIENRIKKRSLTKKIISGGDYEDVQKYLKRLKQINPEENKRAIIDIPKNRIEEVIYMIEDLRK